VDALRNPGAANAPTITPLPFKLPPAVAGKRAPAPPRPGAEDEAEITPEPMTPPFPQPAIVPPPIPPEAMAPTTEMPDPSLAEPPSRSTSPLEETSEMKPVKPPPPPRPESEPGPEETTIRYNCAKCGRKLSAPAKFIGRAATCKCGERMPVPARSTRERGKP
jgi:DNA-directed RNA polymerase subunit RPC12/RpoP